MTGVLLIQLGTPDEPTTPALRRYLRQFLGDPRVIGPWLILNARPCRILNGCTLNVRQGVGVSLPSSGQGAFKGPLGVPFIGPLGAMAGQLLSLARL